jgi:hypothetical protein
MQKSFFYTHPTEPVPIMTKRRGNPQIERYHFRTAREEPLNAKLSMRVTASMLERIQREDDWPEFVREAIAKQLEQR